MLDLQSKKLIQLVAVAAFGMLVTQGFAVRKVILEKAAAQSTVVDGLERWRQQYLAVSESKARWDKQYRRLDSIQGITGVIEMVDLAAYGLTADPDRILFMQATELTHGTPGTQATVPLGLMSICLASSGSERGVLEVSAPTYQALMSGIDKLARRPDIQIGNISVKGDNKEPVGKLGDFCVLLRTD